MYSNSRHNELEPRPMPKPTQFQEISAKPEVPELSVVFNSSDNISKVSDRNPSHVSSQTSHESYSEWKNRQNRSPLKRETREPRDRQYYPSSSYGDYDQNHYSHFSDRMTYKSNTECHKCACQNTPTVKDIYAMMQMQNDQIKLLLETIQTLLTTVLSNQQSQHKCCCFEKGYHHKQDNDLKTTEYLKKSETESKECQLQNSVQNNNLVEEPQISLKINENVQEKIELDKSLKCVNNHKPDIKSKSSVRKVKPQNSLVNKCDNDDKDTSKEKTYSIASDESLDLNESDVQVFEAPVSPEQSIHIEMKSSSEDSSNSECEEEISKPIKVGWTMYNNILGQVNNLLEDSDVAKPIQQEKSTSVSKPKDFEPHKYFMLPENNKIDSSLQMQALAMQYLSPEQANKFDMNKHFVSTQPNLKSPNNYSISTLHYMERYQLIGSERNFNTENHQQKISSEKLLNKKKRSSHKSKTPSKILNITELKQQPKLP